MAQKKLAAGIAASDVKVDVRLSMVKPRHAAWLLKVYQGVQNKRVLIVKGFEKAGIIDALSMDYLLEENLFDDGDVILAITQPRHHVIHCCSILNGPIMQQFLPNYFFSVLLIHLSYSILTQELV